MPNYRDCFFEQLAQICDFFSLGQITNYTAIKTRTAHHLVFCVETLSGVFAVKGIKHFQYTKVKDAFSSLDKVLLFFQKNHINLVNFVKNKNQIFYVTDEYSFLVFPWIKGELISPEKVTPNQSFQVGSTLADIHRLQNHLPNSLKKNKWGNHFYHLSISRNEWEQIIDSILEKGIFEKQILTSLMPFLLHINDRASAVAQALISNSILSHRDLSPHNVIWQQASCWVIDWDLFGWIHPTVELFSTALDWSMIRPSCINEDSFTAVVKGYLSVQGFPAIDQEDLLYGVMGIWLAWLFDTLKNFLQAQSIQEKEQCTLEIHNTLEALQGINHYRNIFGHYLAGATSLSLHSRGSAISNVDFFTESY